MTFATSSCKLLFAPSRVRGLKLGAIVASVAMNAFAPSRVRGLKLYRGNNYDKYTFVRTFTGAWIETFLERGIENLNQVRTFTGAWIETLST